MLFLDDVARRVAPTDAYFQEINETPLLRPEEECELAWRVQEGDVEARDRMVKANLRLVVAIARRFAGRGMCMADLIQEGNLGLVHAVERFDPSLNNRFSTYAKYWINEAMGDALEKTTSPIRLSAYANKLMADWRKAAGELHDELGRHATDEEIAGRLQMSKRQLDIVQKAQRIHHGVARLASQGETGTAAESLVDTAQLKPRRGDVCRRRVAPGPRKHRQVAPPRGDRRSAPLRPDREKSDDAS